MNRIKELLAEIVIGFCDYEMLDCQRDYSGRNMWGSECLGIITEYPMDTAVQLTAYAVERLVSVHGISLEDAAESAAEYLRGRTDNMGREYIVYFPALHVSE